MPAESAEPAPTVVRVAAAGAWAGALLALAGCAATSPAVPVRDAVPAPVVVVMPPPPAPAPAPPPAPQPDVADAAARRLLFFHDQIRLVSPQDAPAEVARLQGQMAPSGATGTPAVALELALALAQTRNSADLTRGLQLLEPLLKSTTPELQPYQPLARLVAARLAEQRRLEDQIERLGRDLKDSRETVRQLNEKLEALKQIERSLNNRVPLPPAAAPVPSAPSAPRS